jgi:hypothetical protein
MFVSWSFESWSRHEFTVILTIVQSFKKLASQTSPQISQETSALTVVSFKLASRISPQFRQETSTLSVVSFKLLSFKLE